MATTTNYGWTTPDDTSLVKDGAAAIRTLGSSVDTTTKALNPSTTLGDIEYRSSTANTNTRLAIGSTGNVLTVAGGVPTWAAPAAPAGPTYAIFTDTKASSTNGGTFTNGAWRTRDLQTTQINDISGCSLASNQVTLPAGTFYVSGNAWGYQVDQHQTRIFNTTSSTVVFLGTSAFAPASNGSSPSPFDGIFTLGSSATIELQHRCATTHATFGFGVGNSWGDNIFSTIVITKVA